MLRDYIVPPHLQKGLAQYMKARRRLSTAERQAATIAWLAPRMKFKAEGAQVINERTISAEPIAPH